MFDRVVVVDWSASSRPTTGRDSIWIAVGDRDGITLANPSTRAVAATAIEQAVTHVTGGATLLAVDFSLGYPAGTGHALGLGGTSWRAMWELLSERIVDDDHNANNRFAVAAGLNGEMTADAAPFWGCPPAQRSALLASTKPTESGSVAQWRVTEEVLRAAGHRPLSSWQLLGAGAVGSQSLVGIPILHRLVERLGPRAVVWPFDTGFTAPTTTAGSVIIVEAWPSMFPIDGAETLPVGAGEVRDARQVATVARTLREHDDGRLADWFRPDVAPAAQAAVIGEEGWILGVS